MAVLTGKDDSATIAFEGAVGVAQHHDAVSGTSKQHVAYDYATRLARGKAITEKMVNGAFSTLVGGSTSFVQCTTLNETFCDFTQKAKSFVVNAYNPLGRVRTELVRLPVSGSSYVVYDHTGAVIPSQTEKSFVAFPKHFTPSPYVLYFQATVPAIGFSTFFVEPSSSPSKSTYIRYTSPEAIVIENANISLTFSNMGALQTILNKMTGVTSPVSQQFLYYTGVQNSHQNSGAYIFRPNEINPIAACTSQPIVTVVRGPVVSEVRTLCGWLAQTVRVVNGETFAEFEHQTSQIPISDNLGKEVITRFTTGIKSNSLYFTDSNGREFQQRKRNYRPTWNLTVTEPVAGNYYPVNVAAYIKDTSAQLNILTDRSEGGASINDGQFELMFHRRLLWDDGRGVGEPLNETDGITPYPKPMRIGTGLHITGSHWVLLESPAASLAQVRAFQSRIFHGLVLGFATLTQTVPEWIQSHKVTGSWLAQDLPINIDLMTLQPIGNGYHILRLSHQFGVGDDPKYAVPVTVDLTTLFSGITPLEFQEVSLTTNQDVSKMKQMEWYTKEAGNGDTFKIIPFAGTTVTITPMDIRTFKFRLP